LPSGVKLLVARNPLRRELAKQRDISYGRSAINISSRANGALGEHRWQ
jgi:hypothetical protein